MKKKEYTVSEVAPLMKVVARTVRLWCEQGRFKGARRIGRDWIIPARDLDGFEKPTTGPKKGVPTGPRGPYGPRKKTEGQTGGQSE